MLQKTFVKDKRDQKGIVVTMTLKDVLQDFDKTFFFLVISSPNF